MQSGTPFFVLQELGGWETENMVRRYAHLAAEYLAVYAEKMESPSTESYGTTKRIPRHSLTDSLFKSMSCMVARGGIEPPTRGFSAGDRPYIDL